MRVGQGNGKGTATHPHHGNKCVQGIKTFSVKLAMALTKKKRTRAKEDVRVRFGTRAIKTRVSESGLFLVFVSVIASSRASDFSALDM